MVLDNKIAKARDHFGIERPEDWSRVRPEWILRLDGVGQATLDHLRLYLAGRGITLRDDATPSYWQQHLETAQIGGQVAREDQAIVEPFTIFVDSMEQQPFTFQGFKSFNGRPRIVPIEYRALGPSHGDYSAAGLERDCHVERKSPGDALGTFLSWGERRDRWERTLAFLAEIPCAAIVVESSFGSLISSIESRGKRSKSHLRRELHRQVLAWSEDLRIPFHFCDDRRLAEATTLAIIERRWRTVHDLKKRSRQIREETSDL